MENVIILGSGCAGFTAAIYTARANLNPLLIEGSLPGGQLTTTSEVENFPGFPEGIDGYTLMDSLRKQSKKFGTRFVNDTILSVDFSGDTKKLIAADKTYEAKTIIIATGASPSLTGVPGEKEMYGGKGVTTCATCDGAFYRDMDVVVIGGGDSACEEALFLTRFCSKVTVIHRRDEFRASKIMSDRTIEHEKIDISWNSITEEIIADDQGFVSGVKIKNKDSGESSVINCKGVFVAIGHKPNTDCVKGVLTLDDQGYIVPESNSMVLTSIPGVYAAGDCVDHEFRQAITAAGMGCQAAISCERWLTENS